MLWLKASHARDGNQEKIVRIYCWLNGKISIIILTFGRCCSLYGGELCGVDVMKFRMLWCTIYNGGHISGCAFEWTDSIQQSHRWTHYCGDSDLNDNCAFPTICLACIFFYLVLCVSCAVSYNFKCVVIKIVLLAHLNGTCSREFCWKKW